MEGRTMVIGDVHGACSALEQVLEKAGLSSKDQLIFMGDYVDGWPESAGVVELLISLSKQYNCIFIKGNHDVDCASWLSGNETDESWIEQKKRAMIESYVKLDVGRREFHLDFFAGLRNYYVDSANRLFVHAGFTCMKGPQEEIFDYNLIHDRTLLEMALAVDENINVNSVFYPKRLKLFKEIYIGHTPTTRYGVTVPMKALNLWDIDTGVTFNGRISVMDVDTKEFWQSDLVSDFYTI